MGIINFFHNKRIRDLDKKNTRKKEFKSSSEMKSVLVVSTVSNLKEWNKWNDYFGNLNSKQRKFTYLGFIKEKSQEDSEESELAIYPTNISWFGNLKTSHLLTEIEKKNYDLIIDMNFDNIFALNLFFIKVKASLRVGGDFISRLDHYYDVKIKTDDPVSKPKLYIDQIFYYLGKIN